MSFGETLYQIRTARLISQKELAQGLLSRTSVSQIEHGKQKPTYSNALLLMNRLGISLDEFEYIDNGYQRNQFEEIVYQFEHIVDSCETRKLKKLLTSAKQYESIHPNQAVKNIICVLTAFIRMNTVERPQELNSLVAPIWVSLEKVDTWTRLDLFLINDILYFFDQKTSKSIAQIALNMISKKFPQLLTLKNAFLLNSGYLAFQSDDLIFANECLKESIVISKKLHRYDLLWLSRMRIASIQGNVEAIEHCREVLCSMGASEMVEAINSEIQYLK